MKKAVGILTLILVLFAATVSAQPVMSVTYTPVSGGISPGIITTLSNGNYLMGATLSGNSALVCVDTSYNVVWTRAYPVLSSSIISEIKECPDKGFVLTGIAYSGTESYGYLLKTDSTGIKEWCKTFESVNPSSGYCKSVLVLNNGFIVEGGTTADDKIFITRLSSQGNTVWTKFTGVSFGDMETHGAILLPDSTLRIAATHGSRTAVLKFDLSGNLMYSKDLLFDVPGDSTFRAPVIINDDNTGLFLAGSGAGFGLLTLAHLDENANAHWIKNGHITAASTIIQDIKYTQQKELLVSSKIDASSSSATLVDHFMRLDSMGNSSNGRIFQSGTFAAYAKLELTHQGTVMFSGYTTGVQIYTSSLAGESCFPFYHAFPILYNRQLIQKPGPALVSYTLQVNTETVTDSSFALTTTFQCMSEVSVDENVASNEVNVFPNPAGQQCTLLLPPMRLSQLTISIHNSLGDRVLEMKQPSSIEIPIDVSRLAEGYYTIMVSDERTVKLTKKLLIIR